MRNKTLPARRGAIYVLVLISSLIVTLIGILAHRMVLSQARVARLHAQQDRAAALAESAVQWGIHYVTLKDGWRSVLISGDVVRTMDLGDGQISITVTDEGDDDLDDSDLDAFTITGTGTIGDAVQTYKVTLEFATGEAHPALEESLTVGGTLIVDQNVLSLESGGTAKKLQKQNGTPYLFFPPVSTTGSNPVDKPDPTLISTWATMGTVIPESTHNGSITGEAFSNAAAPFGVTPDPNGIYVLDADGGDIDLTSCTIRGTLVVVNLGSARLDVDSCRFDFGDHGGPTLIADGDTEFDVGFGPGVSQGIFYIDGDLRVVDFLMIVGTLIVTGNADIDTTYMSINDHPTAVAGPPEGFTEIVGLRVVQGSWERIVN